MSSWLFCFVCVLLLFCIFSFFLWKWISVEAATHLHQPLVLCALYIYILKKIKKSIPPVFVFFILILSDWLSHIYTTVIWTTTKAWCNSTDAYVKEGRLWQHNDVKVPIFIFPSVPHSRLCWSSHTCLIPTLSVFSCHKVLHPRKKTTTK